MDEKGRMNVFIRFLKNHYPSIYIDEEHQIKSGYTSYRGRIDLIMLCNSNQVPVLIETGEEGEERGEKGGDERLEKTRRERCALLQMMSMKRTHV